MHTSDLSALTNLAPVAKSQLERVGFKVDMQSMDWQTTVARTNKKDPPAQGGWSIFVTSWGALNSVPTRSCRRTSTPRVRTRRPAGRATSASRSCATSSPLSPIRRRKAIADELQVRAVTLGTHYPLGEWYSLFAYRTSTKGWLPPMSAMLFWNAEKTP